MLDFSGTESANTSDFEPLPNGNYLVTATEASNEDLGGDKPYTNVTYRVADGDFEGRLIWDRLYHTPKALWRIKSVLAANGAIDADFQGSLDPADLPDMLLGREVVVKTNQRSYTNAAGDERTSVDIKKFIKPQPTGSPF